MDPESDSSRSVPASLLAISSILSACALVLRPFIYMVFLAG